MTQESTANKVTLSEKGEVIRLKVNSVQKIVNMVKENEDNIDFTYQVIKEALNVERILIVARIEGKEPTNIGYNTKKQDGDDSFLTTEEIIAKTIDGEDPILENIRVVSLENAKKNGSVAIIEVILEADLVNSKAFIENENKDIEVAMITSTMLFKDSQPVIKVVMEELKEYGTSRVKGIKEGDKFIAVKNDVKFASIKVNEGDANILTALAEKGKLNFNISDKVSITNFKATLLRDKDIQVLSLNQELENEKKRIVEENILTEEEVDARISYMKDSGIRMNQMVGILKFIEEVDESIKDRLVECPKLPFINYDMIVEDTVDGILIDDSMMLKGPKSVGKNKLIETLAWLCNAPIGEIVLTAQTTNEHLYGQPTVENDNGTSITKFDETAVIELVQKGGFVVLDEINAGQSTVMTPWNSLLDERQRADIPNYKMIFKHPRTRVFGTMNPGYLGVNPLNEAVEDRFNTTIEFENGIDLYKILSREHGDTLHHEIAKALSDLYQKFFQLVINQDDEDIEADEKLLTIRGFQSAYKKILVGQPFARSIKNSVLNKIADRETREALIELVNDNYSHIKL